MRKWSGRINLYHEIYFQHLNQLIFNAFTPGSKKLHLWRWKLFESYVNKFIWCQSFEQKLIFSAMLNEICYLHTNCVIGYWSFLLFRNFPVVFIFNTFCTFLRFVFLILFIKVHQANYHVYLLLVSVYVFPGIWISVLMLHSRLIRSNTSLTKQYRLIQKLLTGNIREMSSYLWIKYAWIKEGNRKWSNKKYLSR